MKTSPIEIDKYRNLRYDFKSIMDLESVVGLPLSAIPILLAKSSIKAIVSVLWVGLKWEDEDLTLEGAAELATEWCVKSGGKYGDLNDVLIKALIDAGWLTPPEESEGVGQGESTSASKT